MGYDMLFNVPDDYAKRMIKTGKLGSQYKIIDGIVYGRSPSVWFTNLDIEKRHEDLILYKKYFGNEKEYPKYDNYDAINVDKTKDIPVDYKGVIGVPISFLDKYNPNQFEILAKTNNKEHAGKYLIGNDATAMINGKKLYHRILIRYKNI